MKARLLFSLFIALVTANVDFKEKSPYNQYLPVCSDRASEKNRIVKKTTAKTIICPMFRDEEGFLSEWVAYYQMHGVDHVMLFDDGSVDRSLEEVKPWIDTGFVSVRTNWTVDSLNGESRCQDLLIIDLITYIVYT